MNEKRWTWVCVQHPMPLLVQDRGVPTVLERIPPWGDPDLRSYLKKFRAVFDSLEEFPELRVDFEISAREMEDVAQEDPATVERMARLIREGKIGLVGGDYSQAHYHVYGAESCLRQIALGLKTFRDLFDYRIEVFFHQETGIHEQLPQILRAFGYTVAVPPRFPWAIQFLEGRSPELTSHYGVLEFVEGHEFTYWQGLDGSRIPLYLSKTAPSQSDEIIEVFQKHGSAGVRREVFEGGPSPFDDFMERERQKHPVTAAPILIENPDMKRLDRAYYESRGRHCRFSLLTDALKERLAQVPVRSAARLYPYWSYIEGVWAEQLSRANRRAETEAVVAESLYWLAGMLDDAGGTGAPPFEAIWRAILSSQHHDIYWIETTEIKRRALQWLEQAIADSQAIARGAMNRIASRVDTGDDAGQISLLLFNTTPHRREAVESVELQLEHLDSSLGGEFELIEPRGTTVPSQLLTLGGEDGTAVSRRLLLRGRFGGLGFSTFDVRVGGRAQALRAERLQTLTVDHPTYRATVSGDGTFSSLFCKPSGTELLGTKELLGNELRGRLDDREWISSRNPGAVGRVERGQLADVWTVAGSLGPFALWQQLVFFHHSSRIDFRVTIDFGTNGIAIGQFWDDSGKLNVFWPWGFDGAAFHDIPFGVVSAPERRPLYCTNWIDVSTQRGGVAYLNRGTTKHWLEGGVLANVLAWGGNWFSNRHPGIWEHVRKYDIRLFGRHTLEYSLYIHAGDWREGRVPLMAEAYAAPLQAATTSGHRADLPREMSLLEVAAHNVLSTAFTAEGDGPFCRIYESHGQQTTADALVRRTRGGAVALGEIQLRSMGGRGPLERLGPFQIAELHVGRIKGRRRSTRQ